jgi:hypothetical protein
MMITQLEQLQTLLINACFTVVYLLRLWATTYCLTLFFSSDLTKGNITVVENCNLSIRESDYYDQAGMWKESEKEDSNKEISAEVVPMKPIQSIAERVEI